MLMACHALVRLLKQSTYYVNVFTDYQLLASVLTQLASLTEKVWDLSVGYDIKISVYTKRLSSVHILFCPYCAPCEMRYDYCMLQLKRPIRQCEKI